MATFDHPVNVAIIDLYDNYLNEGMRCIREILTESDNKYSGIPVKFEVYETRYKAEIPDLSYDIYISSGGPGSPFDGDGQAWEKKYFDWWNSVWEYNEKNTHPKKYVLAICHSFQMMCRFFELATVRQRRSKLFGIMPNHKSNDGKHEWLYEKLSNPFHAAEIRDWQVVEPSRKRFEELGAKVLSREKERPHVPLERSITGIRISNEIVGFQFHPEADPQSMLYHALKPERKQEIIDEHGVEKYEEFLRRLREPGYLAPTHDAVIPGFLNNAIEALRPGEVNGNGHLLHKN